jgi:hypothetical protein
MMKDEWNNDRVPGAMPTLVVGMLIELRPSFMPTTSVGMAPGPYPLSPIPYPLSPNPYSLTKEFNRAIHKLS